MGRRTRTVEMQFPLRGLNRRLARRQQPPYTTPAACNVRPFGTLEGRQRGGSRPGLDKELYEQLGSGNPVRLLAEVTALGESAGLNFWQDTFDGTSLSTIWSTASWIGNAPGVMEPGGAIGTAEAEVGAVRDALTISTSSPYSISIFIAPYEGAFHGKYRLYARMDNTSPDASDEGITAELVMTGSGGEYSGTLTEYNSGTPTTYNFTGGDDDAVLSGWFTVLINGNDISVFWRDHTLINAQTVTAHSGTRIGFGFYCTETGGVCAADIFKVQYYDGSSNEGDRRILVASSNGSLYRTKPTIWQFEELTLNATLASSHSLMAAERGGLLYIADYDQPVLTGDDGTVSGTTLDDTGDDIDWSAHGISIYDHVVIITNGQGGTTDGTYQISSIAAANLTLASAPGDGTCSFRIERAPKIYNPSDDSLTIWQADSGKGQVPSGCRIICVYRDRMVLARSLSDPRQWYMSRQGNPDDWDFGASNTDTGRAVSGANSEAGLIAAPITAVIPFSDDYLVFGCYSSLWVLRGDATYGGQIDALSREVGIVDQFAWCRGPSSELIFLSADGLYMLDPGAPGPPRPLSRELLPEELLDVNPDTHAVSLAFDFAQRGIHVFVTPKGDD